MGRLVSLKHKQINAIHLCVRIMFIRSFLLIEIHFINTILIIIQNNDSSFAYVRSSLPKSLKHNCTSIGQQIYR